MAEALAHRPRQADPVAADRDGAPSASATMVERRKAGEPVAYITGRRAFWNIELHVGPGVLIPRPDSEVLIASAHRAFRRRDGPQRILDLGTGPGTLLLAALDLWPEATGLGVDVSRQALSYAAANARRLGLRRRARSSGSATGRTAIERAVRPDPVQSALCRGGCRAWPGRRASIEPDEALFAGEEGLDAYRALAPQLPALAEPRRACGGRDRSSTRPRR